MKIRVLIILLIILAASTSIFADGKNKSKKKKLVKKTAAVKVRKSVIDLNRSNTIVVQSTKLKANALVKLDLTVDKPLDKPYAWLDIACSQSTLVYIVVTFVEPDAKLVEKPVVYPVNDKIVNVSSSEPIAEHSPDEQFAQKLATSLQLQEVYIEPTRLSLKKPAWFIEDIGQLKSILQAHLPNFTVKELESRQCALKSKALAQTTSK